MRWGLKGPREAPGSVVDMPDPNPDPDPEEFLGPNLREPETEYVREALETLPWTKEHQGLVEDLLSIEKYARDPPSGYSAGMHFLSLKSDHPFAFFRIHQELAPEKYQELVEKAASKGESSIQGLDKKQERLQKGRSQWEEVGGRSP